MIDSDNWSEARHSGTPQRQRRNRRPAGLIAVAAAVLVLVGYATFALARDTTFTPEQRTRTIAVTGAALQPDWPSYGQAAVALGTGAVVAQHGAQSPAAMASTAKLITCLVVLAKKPLAQGQDGPTLTMTARDVQRYDDYVAQDGSVTPVHEGQRLTERDVLEAILLPSANNLADTFAVWAYGSLAAYRTAANTWAKQHGLAHTTIGADASGLAPDSASTAVDLVRLGQLAMANPVVRHIVAQRTAQIPDVGTVYNVDTVLGGGIVGVKTGNSDQNGGVFVGAAVKQVGGKQVTVVSAVSGAPSLDAALDDSKALLTSTTKQLRLKTIVRAGQQVGSYPTPDGTVAAVAARDVTAVQFGATRTTVTVRLEDVSPGDAGRVVGTVTGAGTTTDVTLRDAVSEPSAWHRLTHP